MKGFRRRLGDNVTDATLRPAEKQKTCRRKRGQAVQENLHLGSHFLNISRCIIHFVQSIQNNEYVFSNPFRGFVEQLGEQESNSQLFVYWEVVFLQELHTRADFFATETDLISQSSDNIANTGEPAASTTAKEICHNGSWILELQVSNEMSGHYRLSNSWSATDPQNTLLRSKFSYLPTLKFWHVERPLQRVFISLTLHGL